MTRSPPQTTRPDPRYREVQSGFLALELITEVRSDGVYVRFRPLQRSFARYGFDEIASVEETTYSAADHGGWHWGIRLGPTGSRKAYRISGNRGLRIELTDGKRIFVGSDDPGSLVRAIRAAREGEE